MYFFVTWQVMYDASGIRLHAGKQAAVCNNSLHAICTVGSIAFLYCYYLVIDLYVCIMMTLVLCLC